MIDSLHSLTRSPLPAITTIRLRSNRLTSLAGIERLLSLENLDVQDNQLSDPTEAARLTGIPNLRRIWVKHNRFTRKYPNYRVTIFNLFRSTPGYTDDVFIDDYGPSYSERKSLIDRVPEVEGLPVTQQMEGRSPGSPPPVVLHQANRHKAPSSAQAETVEHTAPRPGARNAQSELAVASARRRRGPRKRIVDLSRPDESVALAINEPTVVKVNQEHPPRAEKSEIPSLSPAESESRNVERAPNNSFDLERRTYGSLTPSLAISDRSRSLDYANYGEDYRQKVEALRQEFGSNWISVLSDQGWDAGRDLPKNETNSFAPPIPPIYRPNSQAIMSSGRTLG
jgi:hypothetical protein